MKIKTATRYDLTWEDKNQAVYNKSLSRVINRAKKQLAKKEKRTLDTSGIRGEDRDTDGFRE